MKLIPNRAMLQDKRIIFCDDSIVRGTQLHDNVKILFDYGAKEVSRKATLHVSTTLSRVTTLIWKQTTQL
jgi:glutamine phosphoribosylpyrophosphate amidotransferase